MRGKSHRHLGKFLAKRYMPEATKPQLHAFLLGCIEPDQNPATYLKGSIRHQPLRGHNYLNASPFMLRISRRLEKRISFSLLDYYTLGKLIHYTADSFTYAHNSVFSVKLADHRKYEVNLQHHFLEYLHSDPEITPIQSRTIMEAIHSYHHQYDRKASDIHRDSRFALNACCCVLAILFSKL